MVPCDKQLKGCIIHAISTDVLSLDSILSAVKGMINFYCGQHGLSVLLLYSILDTIYRLRKKKHQFLKVLYL